MRHVGGDLGERVEDEGTAVHPRVRYDRVGAGADEVAVEQQVKVERAGGIRLGAGAAETRFNVQQQGQQRLGRKGRADLGGAIQVRRLAGGAADGLRLVKVR